MHSQKLMFDLSKFDLTEQEKKTIKGANKYNQNLPFAFIFRYTIVCRHWFLPSVLKVIGLRPITLF